jgi:hypothetical protein
LGISTLTFLKMLVENIEKIIKEKKLIEKISITNEITWNESSRNFGQIIAIGKLGINGFYQPAGISQRPLKKIDYAGLHRPKLNQFGPPTIKAIQHSSNLHYETLGKCLVNVKCDPRNPIFLKLTTTTQCNNDKDLRVNETFKLFASNNDIFSRAYYINWLSGRDVAEVPLNWFKKFKNMALSGNRTPKKKNNIFYYCCLMLAFFLIFSFFCFMTH